MAPSVRSQQLVNRPLGRHFTSPRKQNRHRTASGKVPVLDFGRTARSQDLQARLDALRARCPNSEPGPVGAGSVLDEAWVDDDSGLVPNGEVHVCFYYL